MDPLSFVETTRLGDCRVTLRCDRRRVPCDEPVTGVLRLEAGGHPVEIRCVEATLLSRFIIKGGFLGNSGGESVRSIGTDITRRSFRLVPGEVWEVPFSLRHVSLHASAGVELSARITPAQG